MAPISPSVSTRSLPFRAFSLKRIKFSYVVVFLLIAFAIVMPLVAPANALTVNPARRFSPPFGATLFGTDNLGRDLGALVAIGLSAGAAPALAQDDSEGEKVNQLIVYGDDPCPASASGEITVCARKPEGERYRIPEPLRGIDSPKSEAWSNKVEAYETVGAFGTLSCSPIGPGGSLEADRVRNRRHVERDERVPQGLDKRVADHGAAPRAGRWRAGRRIGPAHHRGSPRAPTTSFSPAARPAHRPRRPPATERGDGSRSKSGGEGLRRVGRAGRWAIA